MTRRTAWLLAFALTLPAVAAPVPKAVKKPPDVTQFDGKWERQSIDDGSGPCAGGDPAYIRDGEYFFDSVRVKGTGLRIRFDPTESPSHFDVEFSDDSRCLGIAQLDGDTWTWCHAMPGKPRPTELKGGNGNFCYVWKRVEEDGK